MDVCELGKEFWKNRKAVSFPTMATGFQRGRKKHTPLLFPPLNNWNWSNVLVWASRWMKINHFPLAPALGGRAFTILSLFRVSLTQYWHAYIEGSDQRQMHSASPRKGGVCISSSRWKGVFSGVTHICGKGLKSEILRCVPAGSFQAFFSWSLNSCLWGGGGWISCGLAGLIPTLARHNYEHVAIWT